MLDAALTALALMLEPARLAVLFAGVLIGLGIGVIPGLGGIVGMALLLPFTFGMDPYMAFAASSSIGPRDIAARPRNSSGSLLRCRISNRA